MSDLDTTWTHHDANGGVTDSRPVTEGRFAQAAAIADLVHTVGVRGVVVVYDDGTTSSYVSTRRRQRDRVVSAKPGAIDRAVLDHLLGVAPR